MQAQFDKVVEHLARQGVKSRSGSNCLYRHPEGLMCAVGCLIPDELYQVNMEGMSSGRVLSEFKFLKDIIDSELASSLQTVHDYYDPSEWGYNLAEVAKDYDITFDETKFIQNLNDETYCY